MTGIETALATGKAVGTLGSLARSSPFIIRHTKRALHRLTKGYAEIAVFGAGGVGKSTAAQIIAGGSAETAFKPYKESLWTDIIKLSGDVPGELKVAPGQSHRLERHWPELFQRLAIGRAVGIINVVAYGYHSLAIRLAQESDIWQPGMDLEEFAQAYIASKQKLELELLEELAAGLSAVTSRVWMATIINKQDLWSDRYAAVMNHYRSGQYAQIIQRISNKIGPRSFQHEYVPTSLAISNLATQSGEIIASSVAGFDMNARNSSLALLSDSLRHLVSQ